MSELEDARTRAKQRYEEGLSAFRKGDQIRSRQLNEEVLEIAERFDDDVSIVWGLIGLSRVAFRDGDHARVRELCERALPLWERLGDRTVVPSPIHMLAESARFDGDLERARGLYERSIAGAGEGGDARFVAMELNNTALLELQAGNLERAEALAKESLSMGAGDSQDAAYCLLSLGAVAARRGDGRRAAMFLALSEAILAEENEVFDPADRPLFDSATEEAKLSLRERFEEAWAAGRSLSVQDAMDLALRD